MLHKYCHNMGKIAEGHASREGIQICLEELLGIHVSTGKISSILHEAGKRAQEWLDQHIPKERRDLAIDEQYAITGEKPI